MNVNGVNNLFPLNKLTTYANCSGYYINAKGEVFSTRNSEKPVQMMGSVQRGSSVRTFTISLDAPYQTRWTKAVSAKGNTLLLLAKQHPDWVKETTGAVGSALAALSTANRNHAKSTAQGIKDRGFVIARLEGEALVFGSKPVIHTTKESATSEVERLANKSPGKTIVCLQIVGAARAASLVWE